jgi:hypothetical protein
MLKRLRPAWFSYALSTSVSRYERGFGLNSEAMHNV